MSQDESICNENTMDIHEDDYDEERILGLRIEFMKCDDVQLGPVDIERLHQYAEWVDLCIEILYKTITPYEPEILLEYIEKMRLHVFKPVLNQLKKGINVHFEKFTPEDA